MRVIARGWARDHGEKDVLDADVIEAPLKTGTFRYSMGNVYLQVMRRTVGKRVFPPKLRISKGAALTLNGDYLVQVEFSRSEIARMFYLTHSDRELHDLVSVFAAFKDEGEQAA